MVTSNIRYRYHCIICDEDFFISPSGGRNHLELGDYFKHLYKEPTDFQTFVCLSHRASYLPIPLQEIFY